MDTKYLNNIISEDDEFNVLTEDVIRESLLKKEENSLSTSSGSESIGTLSGISSFSAFSMTALSCRKQQLIESINSLLNSSHVNINQTPDQSTILTDDVVTSTPYRDTPAAKFLQVKDRKSNFSSVCENQVTKEDIDQDEILSKTRYEEAFSSLQNILSGSNCDDDLLDAYENTLVAYKEEHEKRFEELLSYYPEKGDDTIVGDETDNILKEEYVTIDNNDITAPNEEHTVTNGDSQIVSNKEKLEIESKDPENWILAEGEEAPTDAYPVDEDMLLASDDEVENNVPEKPEAAKLENFVSEDQEENCDNNDPLWESLKNLGSNYDRYRAVRDRWKNLDIPNPKKDLTCRCQRVVNGRGLQNTNKSLNFTRKRPLSPTSFANNSNKRFKAASCTMLYDRCIELLISETNNLLNNLDQREKQATKEMAKCQSLEHYRARQQGWNQQQFQAMKDKHTLETIRLASNFKMRRTNLTEQARQKIDALRRAAAEVREFYEFYPINPNAKVEEKQGTDVLSPKEVEEILETEQMLMYFETFYTIPPRTYNL